MTKADIPEVDRARIEAFALAMGWKLRNDDDGSFTFEGWLTLWPPQSQCYEGQADWLTGEIKSDLGSRWEPPTSEEVELGEFTDLARALAALAARWKEDRDDSEAEMAAEIAAAAEEPR